jgi:hypothetical protein
VLTAPPQVLDLEDFPLEPDYAALAALLDRPQGKPHEPCFTVIVPLLTNARDETILAQRLKVVGQLHNVGLQELLSRAEHMRQDPRWPAARVIADLKAKSRAYADLRYEYGLQAKLAPTLVFKHWRASKWMATVVDNQAALALGNELLQNVDEWLYGRAERPRMLPTDERNVSWGGSRLQGLRLKGEVGSGRLVWNGPRGARKRLSVALDWASLSAPRLAYLSDPQNCQFVRSGVKREEVRGQVRYFALMVFKGLPYRNAEYLDVMAARLAGSLACCDLGVSTAAVVNAGDEGVASGGGTAFTIKLVTDEQLAERQQEQQRTRRRERALDRSRRANNPDCYDEQGRAIKGQRPKKKSRRGTRLEAVTRAARRTDAIQREQLRTQAARQVAAQAVNVAYEDHPVKGWAQLWGQRLLITAPGALRARIRSEIERLAGSVLELPTQQLALSQHCLCGARVKKDLKTRVHACPSCGLGSQQPLDRDLFSAFLGWLVARSGQVHQDLSQGPFNTAEVRSLAEQLCTAAASPRAPGSSTTKPRGNRKAQQRVQGRLGLAREGQVQTPRSRPAAAISEQPERPGKRIPGDQRQEEPLGCVQDF